MRCCIDHPQGAGARAQHSQAKLAVRALCGLARNAGLHHAYPGPAAASQLKCQHHLRRALDLKHTPPELPRLVTTMGAAKRKASEPAAKPAKKPTAEPAETEDAVPSSNSDASVLPLQVNPKRVQRLRDGEIGEGPIIYWCGPGYCTRTVARVMGCAYCDQAARTLTRRCIQDVEGPAGEGQLGTAARVRAGRKDGRASGHLLQPGAVGAALCLAPQCFPYPFIPPLHLTRAHTFVSLLDT